jgi:hypothetical protein
LFRRGIATRIRALLFAADEHQDNREDDTDDYACGEWKIEGEILAFVIEITGKSPNPRYFRSQEENKSQACDDDSDNNENLAEPGKIKHRILPFTLTSARGIAAPFPAMTAS